MAGICGTDVHLWLGQLAIPKPVILGHETVGVIEQLGPGLEKDWRGETLRIGDRVCWASSIACGECFYCRLKAQPTRCLTRKAYGISYNADEAPHLRGGYAEKIHLRARTAIFRIPDPIPTEAVVGAGCALTTAIHGIERCPVQWGDTVVIQGSGPVGIAALAVAKQAGALKLIVTGGPPHRLNLAREFGGDVTLDVAAVGTEERKRPGLAETGGYSAGGGIKGGGHPEGGEGGLGYCR